MDQAQLFDAHVQTHTVQRKRPPRLSSPAVISRKARVTESQKFVWRNQANGVDIGRGVRGALTSVGVGSLKKLAEQARGAVIY